MNRSNYIFRGKNVSIRKHWTGDWELLNSETGEVIGIGSYDKVLEEYDKRNENEKEN